MKVFVNRALNMKRIKAIGFDMDHTIVNYKTEEFEKFTHHSIIKKLIELKRYPQEINNLEFNFKQVIQGLIIDKHHGNLLKLSRFAKVKSSYHGITRIEFNDQQDLYSGLEIDLNDPNYLSLDTNFSVSFGALYSQLVDLKDKGINLPDYAKICDDVRETLDLCHRDGTLKNEVRNNIEKYIIQDPTLPKLMESYRQFGKKLIIITNSDFNYTKLLMDYAFNPFLEHHKTWQELFDITITLSNKPGFFAYKSPYLKVDPETSLMSNLDGKLTKGIYQGGNAAKLAKDLNLHSEEILYLGDHIYGDVVQLKKTFNWRTCLVFEPLEEELYSLQLSKTIQDELDLLMDRKTIIEDEINDLYCGRSTARTAIDQKHLDGLYHKIDELNANISKLIEEYQSHFNPFWGERMRAGYEESRLAGQIEKYACLYVAKVSDLLEQSPRTYFRPHKRILPHERI